MEISGLGFNHEVAFRGQAPDPQKISGHVMEKLDEDGDGVIRVDQLSGRHAERLSGADADQDGLITQDELIKGIEAKIAEKGGFPVGEKPDLQRLKSVMGMMAEQGEFGDGSNDLFSILDDVDASEEDKEEIKSALLQAPFDVLA